MLIESLNNKSEETFHQILERSLNNKFSSRPPKLEISGVLTPVFAVMSGKVFKYKIITDSNEYFLDLGSDLSRVAKKIEWEEVMAKGVLDVETNVFTVERMSLKRSPDESNINSKFGDSNFDIDFYNKTISQIGRLEPELVYLAY